MELKTQNKHMERRERKRQIKKQSLNYKNKHMVTRGKFGGGIGNIYEGNSICMLIMMSTE